MTAMIDVVFLLIIFFMLICQFIVQENYKLTVPDNIADAVVSDHLDPDAVTVSVFPRAPASSTDAQLAETTTPPDGVLYAVRSRQFDPLDPTYMDRPDRLLGDMAERISQETERKRDELVHLRADKDLTYGDVQKALFALARAGITKVQLAAIRSPQPTAETHP